MALNACSAATPNEGLEHCSPSVSAALEPRKAPVQTLLLTCSDGTLAEQPLGGREATQRQGGPHITFQHGHHLHAASVSFIE